MTTEIARFMVRLGAAWDAHVAALLDDHDPGLALSEAADGVSVLHMPGLAGARGREAVERFYASEFLPHLPSQLTRRRLSRTVDRFRLADETTVSFTHDRELPWLLPGVPATGLPVEVLTITVIGFERGRISSIRVLWDHATMAAQLGLAASPVA